MMRNNSLYKADSKRGTFGLVLSLIPFGLDSLFQNEGSPSQGALGALGCTSKIQI